MLACYVVLDLETTGGNPVHDRITEIAAVRIENGQEVARWSSLVNPGTPIPAFIQHLTGISNRMVAQAPGFEELGPRLLALLDGAVLVAHNVPFDHGFLLHEFGRIGVNLRVKTLCTVRLSRRLYPQYRGHGLDAIMQRHGLSSSERHRAMGDVEMVLAWLRLAANELGADLVSRQAQTLLQSSAALPPQLETRIEDIPETAGVYLFFGEGPLPLYIGEGIKLRSKVLSHFRAAKRATRDLRIAQEIRRIEWVQTAGELGARLLEARMAREKQPAYKRKSGRVDSHYAWRLSGSAEARPLLTLIPGEELQPEEFGRMYGLFRSRSQAITKLRELADSHALCPQALGLESGTGRCSAHQTGRCKGVCCGQEKPELHSLRLQLALAPHKLKAWPFSGKVGLREHDARSGRTDIHIFEQWCHLATVHDESALEEALTSTGEPQAFDPDSYRLLIKHLAQPGKNHAELIDFAGRQSHLRQDWPATAAANY